MRVWEADCYFSYEILSNDAISVGGYLSPETDIETLNKNLQSVAWQRDEHTVHPCAYFIMWQDKAWEKAKLAILFVASLILISGLINFLKFIIQMFYNRQREVALRKCMGSEIKGLFLLLFRRGILDDVRRFPSVTGADGSSHKYCRDIHTDV